MKFKIVLVAAAWLVGITAAHVQLNVGWTDLGDELAVLLGRQRRTLTVGFLPVT